MTAFHGQVKLFLLAGCFFIMLGCATTKVPTLKDRPDCLTSIEGFLHSTDVWAGKRPALVLKKDRKRSLGGEIISIADHGVTFDVSRQGPFYDPEEKYYPFEELQSLIGRQGELLHGEFPKGAMVAWGLELWLVPRKERDLKPLKLSFKADEQFGYCVEPGTYFVKEVYFVDKHGNMDKAVDFPDLFIDVEKDVCNYIGNLHLDDFDSGGGDEIVLPYKIHARPRDAFNAGFLGGLIGGALHAASVSAKGIIGEHRILVRNDKDFQPNGPQSRKESLLYQE